VSSNQAFLIQVALGLGINQAVEYKCHLFGWYLGCLFHLKKAVSHNVAQLFIIQVHQTLVILVDKLLAISTQSSKQSQTLGILKVNNE
jgi:hypothetical protein